jgi:hypothetical protein
MADSGSRGVFFIMTGVSARIDSAATSAVSAIYCALRIDDGHSKARSSRHLEDRPQWPVAHIRYRGYSQQR